MSSNDDELSSDRKTFEFHMEEFRLLKSEIFQHDKSKNESEIVTFASVGIVYWFLFSFNEFINNNQIYIIWFLPVALLLVGYMRIIAYRSHIRLIGSYLKKLESKYSDGDLGWERLVDSLRREKGHLTAHPRIIWLPFFFVSIFAGLRFGLGSGFWPTLLQAF